ncbi:MAG: SDR family NAD(P)-dependent oxidoreductase [Deltaproteobacteria bacterium]|nr:SDR family NAD(P)-dependent oxidoreductase [Deltaproteobacteria bacterium]
MKLEPDMRALVTGAASGIGRDTARLLAKRGLKLTICDVDEVGLARVADELGDACERSAVVDVSSREAMAELARQVHEDGALDVLVNNAGVGQAGGLLETSLDAWDRVLSINLGGVIHGCHFFAPEMARAGRGHVVNVSSMLGYFGIPGAIGYSTSKFAVLGLSLSLRAELAGHGVGVSALCPGLIDTGIVRRTELPEGVDPESVQGPLEKLYRIRRFGPERVAQALVRAVEENRDVAPVAVEAHALRLIERFTPKLSRLLGRAVAWQNRRVLDAAKRSNHP